MNCVVDCLGFGQPRKLKLIVPLYIYPGDEGLEAYGRMGQAMHALPGRVDVIVNPHNGDGALESPNSDWKRGLELMKENAGDVGWRPVFGYVYTSYGKRSSQDVVKVMEGYLGGEWSAWVRDIFFDEVSASSADEAYYREITVSILTKYPDTRFTFNCGTEAPSYLFKLDNVVNVVTFENNFQAWCNEVATPRFETPPKSCAMVYNVDFDHVDSVLQLCHKENFDAIYVGDQQDYLQLPSYFNTLVQLFQ